MKKIILSADSTCDLSSDLLEKYKIHTLPLYINLDDKEYKDMVNITPDFIYDYYDKNKVLPKTAAPSIGDYLNHFEQLNNGAYDIIHVSIGSGISASYQNATLAANELDNVYVIDSKSLSTGSGALLVEAYEMINKGKSTDEIVERLKEMREKLDVSFIIDSLTYLREGGRLSALQAFGANLLNIKPSIFVSSQKNGQMDVGNKYRGNINKVFIKFFKDKLEDNDEIDLRRIYLTHSGADEADIELAKNTISSLKNFEEIIVNKASCTISSHCGRNTFGIIFLKK